MNAAIAPLLFSALVSPAFLIAMGETVVQIESNVEIHGSQMTTLNGQNFLAFRGIPYAEPPIGNLRFKPPVPKQWTTTNFDATKEGPECLQFKFVLNIKVITGQEDCLVLNVYTNSISPPLRKVMVFIHGGGFQDGSGSSKIYGAKRLLDHDVVLVTLNSRLGPLGFLSTMDEASPGNFGLLDQAEALKWVQRNIAAFGGDPNKVTLFGQSSGAVCVMNHYISPYSKGLFHRAIAQSGNLLAGWAEQPNPIEQVNKLADNFHCPQQSTNDVVECLRKISGEKLIEASYDLHQDGISTVFTPGFDGLFHTDFPSKLFKNGTISNCVPLLTGFTKDEGLLFLHRFYKQGDEEISDDKLTDIAAHILNIPHRFIPQKMKNLINEKYFSSSNNRSLPYAIDNVLTDGMFITPFYESLEILISNGVEPFIYSYDYISDHSALKLFNYQNDIKGAIHADDLYFLFDSQVYFPSGSKIPNDETDNQFLKIWLNFAETGYPVAEIINGNVQLIPAQIGRIPLHHLNETITVEFCDLKNDQRLPFWSEITSLVSKTKE